MAIRSFSFWVLSGNATLEKNPELVNNEPYTGGWMIKMTVTDVAEVAALLSADDYSALVN